jgi:hypothetical protein
LEASLRRSVAWTGEANLYSPVEDLLQILKKPWPIEQVPRPTRLATLADWKAFWNSPEQDSVLDTPRFRGGNVIRKTLDMPETITRDDFRLLGGSPGERQAHPQPEK